MNRVIFWMSVMVSAFAVSPVWAAPSDCHGNLKMNLQLGSYSFNSGTQQQLYVSIGKSGNPSCDYFITISRGNSTDYNRKLSKGTLSIPYQLYTSNPFNFVVKDIPEANSSNDVISGYFPSGSTGVTQSISYWAVLGNTSYQPWGLYQDVVTVKLYSGTINGANKLEQSQSMTFSFNEPKAIDLSLVPSGAAFDPAATYMSLNFGTLTQGKTLGFDVVVKYNAGYSLSVASLTGGTMRSFFVHTAVPYTLKANGVPADLSGGLFHPSQISSGGGSSSPTGTRIPISVTIGDISHALAGRYGDFLTLVVTSTE